MRWFGLVIVFVGIFVPPPNKKSKAVAKDKANPMSEKSPSTGQPPSLSNSALIVSFCLLQAVSRAVHDRYDHSGIVASEGLSVWKTFSPDRCSAARCFSLEDS